MARLPGLARLLRALPAPALVPVAAASALALGLPACGGSSPASAPPSPASRPSLQTIMEADAQLRADPAATLDTLRRLGVARVKLYVPWSAVAPDPDARSRPVGFGASNPAAYPAANWSYYDTVVRDAAARGVGIDLTSGAPAPRWATGSDAPRGSPEGVWKPSPAEYGQFVHALGVRYSGRYTPAGASSPLPRVDFWAIWNEPNYGEDLAPQAIHGSTVEVSPSLYRGLAGAAWTQLQQTGHGNDTILIGELAPRGITTGDNPGNFSGMVPLRFVRALYCVDAALQPLRGAAAAARECPATSAGSSSFAADNPALFHATGFAVHPYPQGALEPNVVTPGEPDYADLATIPRLQRVLDATQAAYGSSKRFDLYPTEFGYKTDPPFAAGVPIALAPLYLNWSEYLSWLDPRIRSYDQYQLTDPPPGHSQFDTGLEFAGGAPKPTLAAFRLPIFLPATHARRGTALLVWGCVRPARYTPMPQRAQIELRPAGGVFKVIDAVSIIDRDGYFDARVRFPSSGAVRLAWTYPGGPTIHSREVAIEIG